MKESEFWSALELAFGPATGRSLASDLYLLEFDSTAEAALAAGHPIDRIWMALIEETGADPQARWIHRRPVKGRGARS